MANFCDYEVRVKGSKKAGLMVYNSMPCLEYKDFEWEKGSGNSTIICFTGNCKWSVNFGVTDNLRKVNVDSMSESEIESKGTDYWEYSLRAKSEAFQCEIMVHYWSEESGFDQFDHYKNGKVLKQRKIEYNYDKQDEFDWNKLEFVGHEGEYDESVSGEQDNENLMAMLMALGDLLSSNEVQPTRNKRKETASKTSGAKSKNSSAQMNAIEERKKARANREKADKTASQVASDIKSKMRTIESTYERNVNHHKRMIETHTFDGLLDPELIEYISKFDDDIQKLGSDTEQLLIKAIDSYNEVTHTTATPRVVISIVDAIFDAIEYVESTSIHNDFLDLTFKYDWNKINISVMCSELKRVKSKLEKQQAIFEKEVKEQEEKDRRFEEARKYGVAEKDLDKHKKYLADKEACRKTKKELENLETKKTQIEASSNNDREIRESAANKLAEAESELERGKSDIPPKITDIEAKIKALNDAHDAETKSYQAAEYKMNSMLSAHVDEKKEATAVYEVKQEVADAFKEKADRGGLFRKKRIAQYQEKQAEADAAKTRLDDIHKVCDTIEAEKRSAAEANKKNEEIYSGQLRELQAQIDKEKSDLNRVQTNYYSVKKQYDDAMKEVNNREKELEDIKKKIASAENKIAKLEKEIAKSEKQK